jgi:GGDEF domain-containing protein
LGKPYTRFLDRALTKGGDLAAMEAQAMGFDHVQLSARLLAEWGLPVALTEAVGWQHGLADPPRLVKVLRLAEWIARLLADRQTETLGHLLEGTTRQGLEPTREIVERLEEKVQKLADVLSLQLPGGWNYRDLLQRAHEQLADAAAEAAGELAGQSPVPAPLAADGQSLLEEFQELARAAARIVHRPLPSPPRESGDSPLLPGPTIGRYPPGGCFAQIGTVPFFPPRKVALCSVDTDSALNEALTDAATACRQLRCPLSLLLVELDHREDVLPRAGSETLGHLQRLVESACRGVDHPGTVCLPHSRGGFALILPDCDRGPAARLGNQLIDEVRRLAPGRGPDGRWAVSISVGAATVSLPPKNFPARDLLVAAGRCLSGSRASGGGVLKSIEIY